VFVVIGFRSQIFEKEVRRVEISIKLIEYGISQHTNYWSMRITRHKKFMWYHFW